MKSGIYIIKNLINGHFYIGSAININKRCHEHRRALIKNNHCNVRLQRAWDKYGENNFYFKQYLDCDIQELIFYEQLVIDDSIVRYGRENIYNLCLTAGSTLGRMHSDESKIKIGLKSRGRWSGKHHTEKTKRLIGESHLGKKRPPFSIECRTKMRLSHIGKPSGMRGREHSAETRGKMSEANRGVNHPMYGKHHTDESKRKIGDSSRGKPGRRLGIKNKKKI